MAQSDQYFLGDRQLEQERLQRQAQVHADEARGLFEKIGVSTGWHVVEVGCGSRGCLDLHTLVVSAVFFQVWGCKPATKEVICRMRCQRKPSSNKT